MRPPACALAHGEPLRRANSSPEFIFGPDGGRSLFFFVERAVRTVRMIQVYLVREVATLLTDGRCTGVGVGRFVCRESLALVRRLCTGCQRGQLLLSRDEPGFAPPLARCCPAARSRPFRREQALLPRGQRGGLSFLRASAITRTTRSAAASESLGPRYRLEAFLAPGEWLPRLCHLRPPRVIPLATCAMPILGVPSVAQRRRRSMMRSSCCSRPLRSLWRGRGRERRRWMPKSHEMVDGMMLETKRDVEERASLEGEGDDEPRAASISMCWWCLPYWTG